MGIKLNRTKAVRVEAKTLHICAKPSDAGFYVLQDENGLELHEVDGYVPGCFGIGGGDYIEFTLDLETGKIVGWKKPSTKDVEAWIESTKERRDD